mmetsp:Transcript_5757/g.9968  ORF Transcript_5757/g.9968 Transcript_5757/m.9968 type:complete len:351 (+) Transcript_5757:346-1398(+)|eukprot:CAMPEP_0198200034 /NCGR_PEP_ID=MMETSP1445-20131203/3112_1 /TAXON_ID=36898 /ORGANISM="Pyramimonas sp., Strain CCMP2087" /LENGTH=350 /DNA_ID=CAMNT_0043869973 /DNA_START=281 /DNA_END=1333 /DNA_ORIENTATION=+
MKKASSEDISSAKKRRIEALDKAFGSALSDVLSLGPSRAAAASTRAKPPRQSAVTKPSPNRYQPAHVNPSESNTSRGEAAGLSEGRGVSSTTYYETLDENIRNGALSAPLRLAEPLKCSPAEFLDDMLTQLMKTNPTRVIDARAQIASRLQDKAGTLLLDNPSSKFNIESAKEKSRRAQQLKNRRHVPKPLMGAQERRRHKLHQIPSDLWEYSLYEPLHERWTEYAQQLLVKSRDSDSDAEWLSQLVTMDLHGSIVKVVRNKDPARVGVKGIVVMDTCNTLHLISQENRMHVVPKKGGVFEMETKGQRMIIHGNNLLAAQQSQQAIVNKRGSSRATQPNQRRHQNVTLEL